MKWARYNIRDNTGGCLISGLQVAIDQPKYQSRMCNWNKNNQVDYTKDVLEWLMQYKLRQIHCIQTLIGMDWSGTQCDCIETQNKQGYFRKYHMYNHIEICASRS